MDCERKTRTGIVHVDSGYIGKTTNSVGIIDFANPDGIGSTIQYKENEALCTG